MRILASPLDWGLGHATRLSCIIKKMQDEGHDVTLAGSGMSLMLLRQEFESCESIEIKSFSPWFFRYLPQWVAITLQVPKMTYRTYREQLELKRLLDREHFDMILSDNRYGLHDKRCKSILVTHQLSPITASKAPQWINDLFAKMLSRWINRFDEVWVPDIAAYPNGLAGDLSNPRYVTKSIKHIGVLSRMKSANEVQDGWTIDHLAIISGPEPYRTRFEAMVRRHLEKLDGERVIIRGIPGQGVDKKTTTDGITSYNHCSAGKTEHLIRHARNIIAHSGYSTIMDLYSLKTSALLIPTPGQAEQEYLAKRMESFGFSSKIAI